MALQKQIVPLVLGTGIETKTDSKLTDKSKLLELENAYIDKFGTLKKRAGFDSIGKLTLPSNGRSITTYKDELILLSKDKMYSYNDSTDVWIEQGYISDVLVESSKLAYGAVGTNLTSFKNTPSVATLNSITVYAYEDNNVVYGMIIDETTGQILLSPTQLNNTATLAYRPKVIATTRYLYVFWANPNSGYLYSKRIDSTNPSPVFESLVTLTTSGKTRGSLVADKPKGLAYDIVRYQNTEKMVLIYKNSADKINIGYVIETGNLGGLVDGVPAAITDVFTLGANTMNECISLIVEPVSGVIKVMWAGLNGSNKDIWFGSLNSNFTNISSTALGHATTNEWANITIYRESSSQLTFFVEERLSTLSQSKIYCKQYGTVTTTLDIFARSVGLVSKVFNDSDNNIYVVAAFETALQPTYFILKYISTDRSIVMNTITQTEAYGLTLHYGHIMEPVLVETDVRIWPSTQRYQIQVSLVSPNDTKVTSQTGILINKIILANSDSIETREIGNLLFIANGQIQIYDGNVPVEYGFLYYPEEITNPSNATTAGSLTNGTRYYVAVYQWYDKHGQLHLSTTSIPFKVVLSGGTSTQKTTIRVPTLRLTEKQLASYSNVTIGLYRTVDNESIYYSINSTVIAAINNKTVDYIDITDSTSDSAIIGYPLLYTTGGILDNTTPTPANIIEIFNNRVVLANQADENKIEYSKEYQAGVPIEFGDGFNFRAEYGLNGVTSLGRLDEKLIIFKESSMFVQVGNGPLITGQQNDYTVPVLISSEVGCIEPQSIVLTKNGLMFKSKKGYYLLNRSLQTEYKGQAVHKYNNLTVTGAVVIPDLDHVRFVHSDGLCLVYNYLYDEWYTYSNLESDACTIWQNKFILLRTNGEIWKENDTTLDSGSYIEMRLKTAWIQIGGHQGFQRIYAANIIGKYLSRHFIEIKMRYDFDDSVRETLQFDPQTALGSSYYGQGAYYGAETFYGGADGVEQFRVRPAIQKCESIQFELRDYDSEITDGGSLELTGLTLQLGVKEGLFKLRDSKNAVTS
jgi:hypothetical protein